MIIKINTKSETQIYMQLRNQIVLGNATSMLQQEDNHHSDRLLSEGIGINMHTVNKAYSVLRQEGFVTIDRRRGAVVALDDNKAQAIVEMQNRLRVLLANGICKNITRVEVHAMVDECYDAWENEDA